MSVTADSMNVITNEAAGTQGRPIRSGSSEQLHRQIIVFHVLHIIEVGHSFEIALIQIQQEAV
ncbi:hypothetical protein D3C75_1334990 [compost metagenome]